MQFPGPDHCDQIELNHRRNDEETLVSSVTGFSVGLYPLSGRLIPSLDHPIDTQSSALEQVQPGWNGAGATAGNCNVANNDDLAKSEYDVEQASEVDYSIVDHLVKRGVIALEANQEVHDGDKCTTSKQTHRTQHSLKDGSSKGYEDVFQTRRTQQHGAESHLVEAWNSVAGTFENSNRGVCSEHKAGANELGNGANELGNVTIPPRSGLPGAYAEGGIGVHRDHLEFEERNGNPAVDQSHDAATLPNAVPVEDNLEVAKEFRVESASEPRGKRHSCVIVLLLWLSLLLVAILLPMKLLDPKSSTKVEDDEETSAEPPGSNSNTTFIIDLPSYTRQAIMDDNQSPQAKAYTWLLDDPYLLDYTNDRKVQRFALATLFYATNGPYWTASQHWLDYEKNECQWWNLAKLPPLGADACTGGDNFNALALAGNQMQGSIPREVGLLSTLRALVLGDQDNLVGSIPMELWKLSGLAVLSLHRNKLTGTLPSKGLLASHEAMVYMYLAGNQLIGTIPTEIGLFQNLTLLGLGDNQFTGTLPSAMESMARLEYIGAQANALTGTLHPTLFAGWSSMTHIVLRENLLSGTLATEIGLQANLEFQEPLLHLDISRNHLAGSIPREVWHLHGLESLRANSNAFTGSIPSDCGDTMGSSIWGFNVFDNQMTGTIPSSIGLWTNLEEFLIHGNTFEGSLPQELWEITSLQKVGIGGNLIGFIPEILPDLVWLELLSPLLSGVIPSNVCTKPDMILLKLNCSETLCGCDCSCNGTMEV
ncbi:Leucine Rich Repeat [Seminavis robusta]|uniref:Leucine Rich Repeat n=1 Tax=Seminavis robusta TaxID=568900 RepID=A0A9N8H7I8_9STRA|nr:Leucine Rich Repeat [Seminavis robusta]|eukprot:Sro205_g086320.1 Leucine Rich Repeat (765) ;mRNA; r:68684-71062